MVLVDLVETELPGPSMFVKGHLWACQTASLLKLANFKPLAGFFITRHVSCGLFGFEAPLSWPIVGQRANSAGVYKALTFLKSIWNLGGSSLF